MHRAPDLRPAAAAMFVVGTLLCVVGTGWADDGKLRVGTKQTPPFAIEQADGSWTGLSIELWRAIATDLDLEFELRPMDLESLLDGVESGELDVVAAALTVTSDREKHLDFTHPFYSSGLGIAVQAGSGELDVVSGVASALFSYTFLRAVVALALVLLIAGGLVWLFERRRNPEQFAADPIRGLGDAFWWSAVTVTTVGYGDKAPRTLGGRMVALVWMFASVVIVSGFTAAIASSLTVGHLQSSINGPDDLPGKLIATVHDSTSEEFLTRVGARVLVFDDVGEAAKAVADGRAMAVVYDEPLLRHLSIGDLSGQIDVLSGTFSVQDYAFGLPEGSPLRERINRALLARVRSFEWTESLQKFVGKP